ncbi:MAG: Rieske 2Fe-2S domain-containing protein, partial [Saprospiraceae bacterium]|nr:Rieske 2Fe-2S domain-containing protein [Saprospiraceae bacterium]
MASLQSNNMIDESLTLAKRKVREAKGRPNYALDRYFYQSDLIYQRELDHILLKSWIYAGHISELSAPGDWLTFELGSDSVIVVRDRNNQIHALSNTCRHRGARICLERSGN